MEKLSAQGKVLRLLKKYGSAGVPNYVFYQNNVLSPHRRMFELRQDGYIIQKVKEISNGKFYGVWRYVLIEEKPKPSLLDRFRGMHVK